MRNIPAVDLIDSQNKVTNVTEREDANSIFKQGNCNTKPTFYACVTDTSGGRTAASSLFALSSSQRPPHSVTLQRQLKIPENLNFFQQTLAL